MSKDTKDIKNPLSGFESNKIHSFDAATLAKAVEAVTAVMAEEGFRHIGVRSGASTISSNEVISLMALVAYVANRLGEAEESVARRLTDHFKITNVTALPMDQFDQALRYLVDSLPKGS